MRLNVDLKPRGKVSIVLGTTFCRSVWLVAFGTAVSSPLSGALERQAKLGASCRVQVPVGEGLATHP